MKTVTTDLETYLNTEQNLTSCDLYELQLADGHTYYYTDADVDVIYGDRKYKHDELLIKRNQVKLNDCVVVDTMNVRISANKKDKIVGIPLLKAAHNGTLDNAILRLKRCFFRNRGSIGTISLFTGTVEVQSAGGIRINLTVKAQTKGLNMGFPVRKYYPQGTYTTTDKTQVISSHTTDTTCLIAPFVPRREVLI
ncbi:DUF2163 domain-containing protein [Megasphaera sp. UPII 135-E]|uniref:baseplate hub domain-containing protein n=1 Tax=Megasphaera sp. UPII 135-E TaxID=1000569 RepID=UPI00021A1FDE|nr:DUF2163 domain-containing protein [Megasphaera sp. UPII 135-E]EGS36146.1 conserved domain protein [Megasphaera sp. UPII 135-E]